MHVVVDEHDGAPVRDPLDQRDGAVDVLDAHAGGRLVEQQQPRVQRQGQGQLEGPLLPVRERAGEHPGPVGQADLLEQVHGAWAELAHLLLGAPEPVAEPGRRGQGQLDVVDEGHLVEQAGDLERAGHAEVDDLLRAEPGDVAVAEVDRARGGRQEAGEQVEQGGLAGAVRARPGRARCPRRRRGRPPRPRRTRGTPWSAPGCAAARSRAPCPPARVRSACCSARTASTVVG